MKKIYYLILALILVPLTISAILDKNEFLSQILGGALGGLIALIGVSWTLNEQQKQNNEVWTHQREEWRRQDERYREDWRMKVQPWLEIQQRNEGSILWLNIEDREGLHRNFKNPTDYSVSHNSFTVRNTGKDAAFISGIRVDCPRGSYMIVPNDNKRLLPCTALTIDMQTTYLYFQKGENYTLHFMYDDILGNTYIAELSKKFPDHFYGSELTSDDGTSHMSYRYEINGIKNPILLKQNSNTVNDIKL